MKITMIGHSTLVIEMGGRKIITDPYFSAGGNPAYARLRPPAYTREDALQNVDLVLLSHHHFDHADRAFFRALPPEVPVLAPRSTLWLTRGYGAKNPVGIRVWETRTFGTVMITAVPASHVGVTIGFVIESENQRVYFAADTYHRPFMREIGRRFRLDAALLPVTTYRLPLTMGEAQAVRAVEDLTPDVVLPIHRGIQPRSPLMRTTQSVDGFARRLREAQIKTSVVALAEGESWTCP